jgi:AAA15 family ATPase/GTPase
MLLRFGVANLWSIREYQELSLVASSLTDDNSDLLSTAAIPEKVVSAVGLYGANASGKSNVLRSFWTLRGAILNSHKTASPSGGTDRATFALNPASKAEPSRLDCDFVLSGIRYHYGFSFDDAAILKEWLYAYPKGRRQIWYIRNLKTGPIEFGKNFSGRNKVIEDLTLPNSLFLSTAAQNNHDLIKPIYSYFENQMTFLLGTESPPDFGISDLMDDPTTKAMLMDFIKKADIGITDITIEEKDTADNDFSKELYALITKHIKAEFPRRQKFLKLGHRASDGSVIYFDLKDESRGTIQLLRSIGPMLRALKTGGVLVQDEIDSSLHPAITMKLVEIFGRKEINKQGAQLIFSTHDTNVICCGKLRRDQIWFTEKKKDGSTILYPLSDISTRKSDNFAKGYLDGRFGAIPFLGALDSLLDKWALSKPYESELSKVVEN